MTLPTGVSPASLPAADAVRAWFPTLQTSFAFLENAGGSQVPAIVADAVREYMLTSYVQLGAGYPASQKATAVVNDAHAFIETWVNAGSRGKVALGASATALINVIANAYAATIRPGDEIIVCETNHEANAGPWVRLQAAGATIKIWKLDLDTLTCPLEGLQALLTERTKLVAFPHVSNLLGRVVDVKAVTELVHAAGAKVFVDGVAYAPHGIIDVSDWNVDWYIYSNYKVYGPHMASLYGTHEAFSELTGPNHYFIPKTAIPQKFELGALNHEGCAGLLGLWPYLQFLSGRQEQSREAIVAACEVMTELERPLTHRLLTFLESKPTVRIIGPGTKGGAVGTVSFLSSKNSSLDIANEVIRHDIGIRNGHMYALRMCEALGLDLVDGVVRVSLLHYNTLDEIDRLVRVLAPII